MCLRGRWALKGVDCEILRRLERKQNISYKGVEPLSSRRVLITVRLTAIRNRPNRTIFASSGLELLQMVSEPDTRLCATEDARPLRGWIVKSHIGWRRE